ncbi:MAG: hypothetical protein K5882_01205, partial [Bacteroidales bacterium]|nr:hypothetical protein [Bacteroidales bacterium]
NRQQDNLNFSISVFSKPYTTAFALRGIPCFSCVLPLQGYSGNIFYNVELECTMNNAHVRNCLFYQSVSALFPRQQMIVSY